MIKVFKYYFFVGFLLLANAGKAKGQTEINREAEQAILTGKAEITNCSNASGGQMVKGLSGGESNALLFNNLEINQLGEHFIRVYYYATDERVMTYKVNGGAEQIETVPGTGAWCYQGGYPGSVTIRVDFQNDSSELLFYDSPIIDRIMVLSDTAQREPAAFYISAVSGDDLNDGLSQSSPWQTIQKANSINLVSGDSILFKSGETFKGNLKISNESGSNESPIIVSSYGNGEYPVIDGNGYLSAIHVLNSSYVHFSNLEIKNNGGVSQVGVSEDLRYGMYIENTFTDGTVFEHFRLNNLIFRNIFPTTTVTDNDKTGVNAYAITSSGSWGDEDHPTRFRDVLIENCYFTRTARHAAVFAAIDSLEIRNNLFEHVGGAGMVIGNNCSNILVEKNVTNYTGSKIDTRMAGRGSGLWCFRTKNLIVQHNKFMHAHGIKDSYGMHIDIGNRNVVYQYNYSEDNEGGFVEILGENVNVGYRYNLSVGDGWRKRGTQMGQIFWFSGWSGNPQNPIGSDSIFVYNNSIYVRDSVAPGIWIESVSRNARIYNNIIHVTNQFGPVVIKNDAQYNDFDNNLWHGDIPEIDEDGETYRGSNAITSDPLYKQAVVVDSSGFILQKASPAISAGKLIYSPNESSVFNGFISHGGQDYFGNTVSEFDQPNMGAYNSEGITVGIRNGIKEAEGTKVYPNPSMRNSVITIDLSEEYHAAETTISVYDFVSRLIAQSESNGHKKIQIKTPAMPGLYFVRIQSLKAEETMIIQNY